MSWFDEGSWFLPESWFDGESPLPLSGGGPGTLEIKLRLGSDTVAPCIWPHLCDKITLDWSDPNITSCKAYLEGQDGTRVLLNDNEPGVAKYRPSGQTTEYAGSWAQDFGANGVTDAGIDHAPITGGISGGNMANWELATAFQMLADRTATYLVWVADVDDTALGMTVEAPLFEYTKSADRKIIWENAHQAAVIHPLGPGVRFAGFNTGTSGTINNPPALYDGFERPNVVDWLVFERLLVRGVAHDDGLTTELTTLYDSYEGNSVGQVRTASHGFLLPVTNSTWSIALVNSLSEVPPLAGFPRRRRSQTTWLETGVDFVQHSYAGMQSPDYFVNPSQGIELRTDDDVTVWTSSGSGVTGWAVTQHEEPVANDETDFGVWLGGTRYGELRPFRGHYMVIYRVIPGGGPWNFYTPWGHYHRLSLEDSDVIHNRAEQAIPFGGFESTATALSGYEWARATYDPTTGGIIAVVSDGTDAFLGQSNDDGGTYNSVATILTTVKYPTINHTREGGVLVAGFRLDTGTAGTIVAKYKGPGDSAYSSEFTFEDAGGAIDFEEDSFHFSNAFDGSDVLTLVAKKAGATGVTEFYSADQGRTWTEV